MSTQSRVRDEDSFDVTAMDRWLRTQVSDLPDAHELPDGLPQVTQFMRGASNLTYRLSYGRRDLVLRRPPAGTKAASAHDMGREVHVITHVRDQFSYVPRIDAYCTDDSVIGSPFYVMEYLDGYTVAFDQIFATGRVSRGAADGGGATDGGPMDTEQAEAIEGKVLAEIKGNARAVTASAADLPDKAPHPARSVFSTLVDALRSAATKV